MNGKGKIIELLKNRLPNTEMYFFGSVVYSNRFKDVDIAIIYDKTKVSFDDLIKYRIFIENELHIHLKLKSDILMLSIEENDDLEFLTNSKNLII